MNNNLKVKKNIGICLILFAITMFSGCGKEKISYETEIDDVGSVLKTELDVPKSCTYEFTSENDNIFVSLETENIVLPDTDELPIVYYEKNICDSAYKKQIAEGIFDKADGIYVFDGDSLPIEVLEKLESYYGECIEIAKKQGDNNASEMYEEILMEVKKQYESANEQEPTGDYSASEFIGYINGRSYLLSFEGEYGGFKLSVYPEEFIIDMISVEDKTYAYLSTTYGDAAEQDLINMDAVNTAKMSRETACYEAYEFLNNLGITDITDIEAAVNEWACYDLIWGQEKPENICDGYYITFIDEINNVMPYVGYYDMVTSLSVYGEYKEGKTVSTYEVCLNDNGIISVTCHDKYIKSSEWTEPANLLSWNEMLEAATPYIEDYYSDKSVYSDICFNCVYLSYYETKTENDTYEFKPAWIFLQINNQSLEYNVTMFPEEMLVIDATTGEPIEIP